MGGEDGQVASLSFMLPLESSRTAVSWGLHGVPVILPARLGASARQFFFPLWIVCCR